MNFKRPPIHHRTLKRTINSLIADQALTRAVLKATRHSVRVRDEMMAEINNYQDLSLRARDIRSYALENLDDLLTRFQERFLEGGGIIHWAETAEQARRKVIEILKGHNARYGVKGKSMVSEEVGLGEALEKEGIDFVESDLGEFIVQLRREAPSHITAPALHLSAHSIAQLFQKRLGMPPSSSPSEMTRFVRKYMRERFINAQFAISGANFLVAETGHMVLVENEGNGKAGWTLAPLVIVITGIEKLVSQLKDLPCLVKLLTRSATGQRASVYLHFIQPPLKQADANQEIHLILVDNGRREALQDPHLREILLCIRCGACLNICPVYRTVGGHGYLSVYPGPMGAIWSNVVKSAPPDPSELAELSTLCGACREICPVGINIPRMLLEIRARREKPWVYKLFAEGWRWTMASPRRLELLGRYSRKIAPIIPPLKVHLAGVKSSFREKFSTSSSPDESC